MIFDANGRLLNEFGCWELVGTLKLKKVLPVPATAWGNYIHNARADVQKLRREGVAVPGSDPADLAVYGNDNREAGWMVGFDVGNRKQQGDWYFRYFYQEIKDYAFPAVFVDSDFHGGGTNAKGHHIHGRYLFHKAIQARATVFLTERQDVQKDGVKDEDRIQLDMAFSF
jgi:hypothetical protein